MVSFASFTRGGAPAQPIMSWDAAQREKDIVKEYAP